MWQTKYAFALPKNLGVGVNFRPCSEGYFLSGCPQSVPCTYIKLFRNLRLGNGKPFQLQFTQMYYFQMFLPQTRNIIFFCLGRNFDRPSEPTASYKHFIGRNTVPLKMTKFNLFVISFPGLSRFNGLDRLIRPKFKSNVLLRCFSHKQGI